MRTGVVVVGVFVPALALAEEAAPTAPPPTSAPSTSAPPPATAPPSTNGPPPAPPSLTPRSHALPYTMWPEELELDATKPLPDGYTLVRRRRKGLIVGGAIALGVSYTLSAYYGLRQPDPGDLPSTGPSLAILAVPIAGPFVVGLTNDYDDGSESFGHFKIFLVGLGCAQVAGAIMLYLGLTSERALLIRNDLVSDLRITPVADANASGLVLSGGF